MSTNIHANVATDFSPEVAEPRISPSAYVHPLAAVIGAVQIGRRVMVSPGASVRGDEGQPICVDDEANVQDGVVIHALETWSHGKPVDSNTVQVNGRSYAVHVGKRVSLAHQVQIHGPARVGDSSFIGMQSLVFKSEVGSGCVVEPKCLLLGVTVADGRYVPAGTILKSQEEADKLPVITADYPFRALNDGVVHVNTKLADEYNAQQPAGPANEVDQLIRTVIRENLGEMIRSIIHDNEQIKRAVTDRTLHLLGCSHPTTPSAPQASKRESSDLASMVRASAPKA